MAVVKHGGAAGGVSAGLYALANAQLVNGIDHFLEMTGFAHELTRSTMVITGEGSLDSQTLQGKGPFGVAEKAKRMGLTVIGMAGKISEEAELKEYFDKLLSINEAEVSLDFAIRHTYNNLLRTARLFGNELAASGQ
jgi:glycerate 2-kinase